MDSTTKYLLPYPEDDDTPDVPRDIKALAERVEVVLDTAASNTFASAAERDAFYASIGGAQPGMLCFRTDTGWYEYWTGTVWQPFAGSLPELVLQFGNASNIATSASGARFTIPVATVAKDSHPGAFAINMADGSVTINVPGTYAVRGAFMSEGMSANPRTIGVDIGDLTESVLPGGYAYSAPTSGFPMGRSNISVTGSARWTAGQKVALWHAGDANFGTLGSSLRLQMTGA